MAAEADARTLCRRVHFDLTGLPPTADELDAFVADPDPARYEKLVDRLLASPRYGERWARHWLDVVHYADTHGYDKDKPRENAWPYRDYVIRALNEDKPYARFVEEQIAGNALHPGTRDGMRGSFKALHRLIVTSAAGRRSRRRADAAPAGGRAGANAVSSDSVPLTTTMPASRATSTPRSSACARSG